MAFITDTFTEASDTALESHTPDVGGTWVQRNSSATVKAATDRVEGDSTSSTAAYHNDAAPGSAEYDVIADIQQTASFGFNRLPGLIGRFRSSAPDHNYQVYYNSSGTKDWRLEVVNEGSATLIGSYTGDDIDGVTRTIKLEIRNATKKVFIDDVERISSSNNDVTDANFAGLRLRAESFIDNYSAAAAGGGPAIPALDEGHMTGGLQPLSGGLG